MTRSPIIIVFICLGAFAAIAQQPTPPADDAVVKISTDLIQVDVTVTDKKGNVVTGLGQDDFVVTENGEKQKLTNFSFISGAKGGASIDGTNGQTTGLASPTSAPTISKRRTIAVVVDDLNLSYVSIYYAKKALRRFIDTQMEPNDLVAIICTGGGIGLLQQFTTDKQVLRDAVERIRWNPLGSGGLDSLGSVGQTDQEVTEMANRSIDIIAAQNDDSGRRSILVNKSSSEKTGLAIVPTNTKGDFERSFYAEASMGSLRYIISGMSRMPGRKIMMLFSDGFALHGDGKSRASVTYQMIQDLVDLANRSSVVAYTFDTKGMRSMSIEAADNTFEVNEQPRDAKILERMSEFKSTQESLAFFAGQTGGKALLNSNDLNGGIERALDEQTGYYLLGYVPDAESFDPAKRRFNKLDVRVARPGMTVSYRSGFFGTSSAGGGSAATVADKMANALVSPFAQTDISVNMAALYADDPKDGPYLRSFLHIDAKDLTFTEDAEGWKKATFDVAAVTFDDNGTAADRTDSKYTIKAKGLTYDTMLSKGFVYVLVLPVKKPGLYQYRVALRDEPSGKIGSASQIVDIPDLKKPRLAISSLAVENVSTTVWDGIVKGKVGNGPGQVKVTSTLLYDTVIRQFPAGTVLRYGYEVYNASAPRLDAQARIYQNNRLIVDGTVTKPDTESQPDPKHLKVSSAVMLKDTLPPGEYVLQITVTDPAAKRKATQILPFEIIK